MTTRPSVRLQARQRQILFERRAIGQLNEGQISHLDREALEVLADVVAVGANLDGLIKAVASLLDISYFFQWWLSVVGDKCCCVLLTNLQK